MKIFLKKEHKVVTGYYKEFNILEQYIIPTWVIQNRDCSLCRWGVNSKFTHALLVEENGVYFLCDHCWKKVSSGNVDDAIDFYYYQYLEQTKNLSGIHQIENNLNYIELVNLAKTHRFEVLSFLAKLIIPHYYEAIIPFIKILDKPHLTEDNSDLDTKQFARKVAEIAIREGYLDRALMIRQNEKMASGSSENDKTKKDI